MESNDYHIIKINYYASKYLLKKWHETGEFPKQHWENARAYNEFFWKFFEKVTGHNMKEWYKDYYLFAKECALEHLESDYDVIIAQYRDGVYSYFIPVINNELYEWCIANIRNKYKIGKRCRLPLHRKYGTYDKTYWRNLCKSYNDERMPDK